MRRNYRNFIKYLVIELFYLSLAMYLSGDSHQATDLPDHTLIGVYRLSILAHVLSI